MAHYTRADTAFELILAQDRPDPQLVPAKQDLESFVQLKLSPLANMRDPAETRDWGLLGKEMGLRQEAAGAVSWRAATNATKYIKILSTTRDADQDDGELTPEKPGLPYSWRRSFSHPRLWEQYSSNHAGVCLLLDRTKLVEVLATGRGSDRFFWCGHGAVTYGALGHPDHDAAYEIARIDEGVTQEIDNEIEGTAIRYALDRELRDWAVMDDLRHGRDWLLYRKAPDWATEAEYRFAVGVADHEPVFLTMDNDVVRAVILGFRFPMWATPGAFAECEKRSVPLYRGEWDSAGLRLEKLS